MPQAVKKRKLDDCEEGINLYFSEHTVFTNHRAKFAFQVHPLKKSHEFLIKQFYCYLSSLLLLVL